MSEFVNQPMIRIQSGYEVEDIGAHKTTQFGCAESCDKFCLFSDHEYCLVANCRIADMARCPKKRKANGNKEVTNV